jgi:hypothetical protein
MQSTKQMNDQIKLKYDKEESKKEEKRNNACFGGGGKKKKTPYQETIQLN